ncbi:hypothetical protein [Tunturiibacter lichenicola]|uniref:hypothetical protein n=1 Tax=Tunturiibacter lichenicola TaxID=2051959 RepID=UPI003D9B9AB8
MTTPEEFISYIRVKTDGLDVAAMSVRHEALVMVLYLVSPPTHRPECLDACVAAGLLISHMDTWYADINRVVKGVVDGQS